MLGDARLASQFADEMLKRGIYVIGFSYPVVCLLIKILFLCDKNSIILYRYQKIVHVFEYKYQPLIQKLILNDVLMLLLKLDDNLK